MEDTVFSERLSRSQACRICSEGAIKAEQDATGQGQTGTVQPERPHPVPAGQLLG